MLNQVINCQNLVLFLNRLFKSEEEIKIKKILKDCQNNTINSVKIQNNCKVTQTTKRLEYQIFFSFLYFMIIVIVLGLKESIKVKTIRL